MRSASPANRPLLRTSNGRLSVDLRSTGTVSSVRSGWPLRLVVPTIVLSAIASSAGPAAAAARQDRLPAPVAADVARAGAAIPDGTLSTTSARSLAASATWGGTFTASTGEQVH